MLLAVTADLHLTSRAEHPERFRALEDILKQMLREKITVLVVAGDLFHESGRKTSEFEAVCRDPRHRAIQFIVLPGNHDGGLTGRAFAADNVFVVSEPELRPLELTGLPILFMPYRNDATLGEAAAVFESQLPRGRWILAGHGDWVEGLREPNPMEPGVYMPLTRTDVEILKPARVLLGHVHKPMDRDPVHIPGSPCGLDITETGPRRFLVLDTETGAVSGRLVETDTVYRDETLVVVPADDEARTVKRSLEALSAEWGRVQGRVTVRLTVSGYTRDKSALEKTIRSAWPDVRFYKDDGPDLSDVAVAEDAERTAVAERVREVLSGMQWPEGADAPARNAAFLHALKVLYEP